MHAKKSALFAPLMRLVLLSLLLASSFEFVVACCDDNKSEPNSPQQLTRGERVQLSEEWQEPEAQIELPANNVKDYVLEAIPVHDTKLIRELTDYAVDYCHLVGNVMLWKDPPEPSDLAVVPPISLLPSPFPKELFEKAHRLQPLLNELYFRVGMDHDFLRQAYKHLMEADPWIKRQVLLMERVQEAGIKQTKSLIVLRADYLTHQEGNSQIGLKQVEVNSGQFGGMGYGTNMSKLHRKMVQKIEHLHHGNVPFMRGSKVPEATSVRGMAEAMLRAWQAFVEQYGDEKAVIVFFTEARIIPASHFEQLQFIQVPNVCRQQRLAEKGVLEHFLGAHHPQEAIDELRSSFVGLWGLEGEDPETEALVRKAIESPGNFVLKAQLGGGKGNYFDAEVQDMLQTMSVQERSAYTLMERIRPIAVKNHMRRPFHKATTESVNTELSIFGTFLGDGTPAENQVIFNAADGYMVRSKLSKSNQGGISEGYGLFDSLLLFPTKAFLEGN